MKVRDVLRLLKDPDLPGCAATGQTIEETEQQIREAIDLHLRGMREDGLPIPEPSRVLTMCGEQPDSSPQHRANSHYDQINDSYHNRDLDEHDCQPDQHSDEAERHAGGCQHQGDANCQNKNHQQNDANYPENVTCFFHLPCLRPFVFSCLFSFVRVNIRQSDPDRSVILTGSLEKNRPPEDGPSKASID